MATVLIERGSIDLEVIKDQHPLAEVVTQHGVVLKRKSGNLVGLCPFHNERTPSFNIYENDQRFHCFGCGARGDVFDFIRETEGLDLCAAVERLTGGIIPQATPERIEELRRKKAAFEAAEAGRKAAAIQEARTRWMAADPHFLTHPYLDAKGIGTHGTKVENGTLLISLIGDDGIQSLQMIDSNGRKLFLKDAPVSGGLYVVGGKVVDADKPVIVCEGFATAASLHEATGCVTVCAFNSGNLTKVAERLAEKYPTKEYVVAGDDDRGKDKNVGREAALKAAAILKGRTILPVFPVDHNGTDFNDMAQHYGQEAVKALVLDGILPNGEAAPEPPKLVKATPFLWRSEAAIPPRKWLYGRHLLRKFVSVDVAAGGVGKSSLKIGEALAMASNRPLYGKDIHEGPLTVWLFNLEDPAEETERRIHATAKRFDLKPEDFADRLYVDSGRDQPLVIATEGPNGVTIAVPVVDALIAEIKARGIDVLDIDPFVSSHEVSENDNKAVDKVAKEWARIADVCNCSINLVHHIKKMNGAEATAESARGAGALIAAARSVVVYNKMTKDEAAKAGISELDASFIFRTTNDKANLSPPEAAEWYRMNNVDLDNGDKVGVACSWEWPDVFAGIGTIQLASAQKAVAGGNWRESNQSNNWVGHAIGPAVGLDPSHPTERKKLNTIIKTWIANGAFEVVEQPDEKRMMRKFVAVGEWVIP